jgi:hypothetical protein
MSHAILKQVLEQLQSLEPAELQQLNQAVQEHLLNQEETAKHVAFHQALVTAGLVKQIKKPSYKRPLEQQPIQVVGEPISRTIVEERR